MTKVLSPIEQAFSDMNELSDVLADAALEEFGETGNEELREQVSAALYAVLLERNQMKVTEKL